MIKITKTYKVMNKFKGIVLLLLALLSMATAGHCAIHVMPMEVEHQAPAPGARVTDEIEVLNSGDEVMHISASVMDWTLNTSGTLTLGEPGTLPRSCAPWIQLNPMSFAVMPKQSVRVRYTIDAPNQLTEERWAMIFFKTRPMPAKDTRLGLNISTRIGCKVFLSPNKPVEKMGKVTDMQLEGDTLTAPKVKVAFANTGESNIRVQGKVEVCDETGQALAKADLAPMRAQVLPGTTRELVAAMDKPLPPGTYRIKAIIDYGAKQLIGGELKTSIAAPIPTSASPSTSTSEQPSPQQPEPQNPAS
jgi:hypothetical protein